MSCSIFKLNIFSNNLLYTIISMENDRVWWLSGHIFINEKNKEPTGKVLDRTYKPFIHAYLNTYIGKNKYLISV